MSQPTGIYVTPVNVDATTNTDPTKFTFNSNYDVYKYIPPVGLVTVTVTDFGGLTPTTASNTYTIPNVVNFRPFFFSWITQTTGSGGAYDFYATNVSTAYTSGNVSGGSINLNLNYLGGGATPVTVTAYIYIFGNQV